MNANTKHRDQVMPPREQHVEASHGMGSEQKNESTSQLRSRLLTMILESEQNRKHRIPATPIRR